MRRSKRFERLIVEDDDALQRLIPGWWSLWNRIDTATPFTSPAWLLPWWRTFGPGRLLTVAIRSPERLVALLPAYVEDGPFGRRLLPLGIGISDDLDILLDPAEPDAAEALVGAVLSLAERYDSWELEELSPAAAGLTLPIADPAARPRAQSACPVLDLFETDDWSATKPGRVWRRAWNRVTRHGEVAVERAAAGNVHRYVDDLIALHGRRWNETGESGVLAAPEVQAFHRQAAPDLLEAGLLHMLRLRIGTDVVALYYGFLHRGRAFGYLSGFDPAWTFESPGTALLGYAIHDAQRQGCREFNFLRGQEAYKYAWGAVDRWNQARTVRPSQVSLGRSRPPSLPSSPSAVAQGPGRETRTIRPSASI